jgi:catechol 2,3-dioxygenase-like lactoylglutathione lyase family enzyme
MEGTAPIMHVADAETSISWYGQLGFEVEFQHRFEPGMPLYVGLRRGPARLHLSEHRLDGAAGTQVYLYVDDVNSVVPPGTLAEDCPWGMREAHLTDPDGNEVRIGAPLAQSEAATPAEPPS